jgi:hypothetical protein
MSSFALDSFEWHDLPVTSLSVTESGFTLVVTPYLDDLGAYISRALVISDAETIQLDITGLLTRKDLDNLEVSSLSYTLDSVGHISGTLGLLPGHAGFWSISFAKAMWSLGEA